ncbi:MAG: HAD-IB family hydrolase [Betaproteobacteria bacterium HGW-Betaproteobacteria-13]|jgi:HAD superfamily hydrolase (TIGR01490 family)|uniref:Phosphoserine phosphatase n=1 Tax=Parazoarcus communis TaxID=41977 RepID=A0A2U8GZX7_9RHOO|nr:HAD family hydrolase [Parazoarcus communis]AWI78015.1 phosphoserine phosphatase [Parazoarcus communis]PKO80456.1 MAG: HAD-IB family hydrolase [Betaproteobacteria bacterium HGW-Betaproteobacteria-13]
MDLVLFDLDNTLLAGDSDFAWAQFLIGKGVLDREVQEAKNIAFYEQYKSGTLDIHEFLDFQLAPLARHPREQLDTWHREFMEQSIRPMITPKARALVEQHLSSNAMVAVVTATNSFVTGPIVREFGIPHLIATIPAQENGQFTGKPRGTPSFKAGKIERVDAWLESLGLHDGSFDSTWFYSDSHNDLPLMQRVQQPVAVDPDDTLRAYAASHAWPVISLR